jgi:ribosomal protein S14
MFGRMRRVIGIGAFSALSWNRYNEAEVEASDQSVDSKPMPSEYNCDQCGNKKGYFRDGECPKCKRVTGGSHFGFTK